MVARMISKFARD